MGTPLYYRMSAVKMAANCIFCRIIKGEIPSMKLYESDKTFAFLDINPLSKGHALVIPKYHGAKLTGIPDEHLRAPPRRLPNREGLRRRELQHSAKQRPSCPPGRRPRPCAHDSQAQRAGRS